MEITDWLQLIPVQQRAGITSIADVVRVMYARPRHGLTITPG